MSYGKEFLKFNVQLYYLHNIEIYYFFTYIPIYTFKKRNQKLKIVNFSYTIQYTSFKI